MKDKRKRVILATVLPALLLAGLLLVFGLAKLGIIPAPAPTPAPGSGTPALTGSPAATGTPAATPTDGTLPATPTPSENEPTATPVPEGPVNPELATAVYVLNVGESSCTLLCSGRTAVLIDGVPECVLAFRRSKGGDTVEVYANLSDHGVGFVIGNDTVSIEPWGWKIFGK